MKSNSRAMYLRCIYWWSFQTSNLAKTEYGSVPYEESSFSQYQLIQVGLNNSVQLPICTIHIYWNLFVNFRWNFLPWEIGISL